MSNVYLEFPFLLQLEILSYTMTYYLRQFGLLPNKYCVITYGTRLTWTVCEEQRQEERMEGCGDIRREREASYRCLIR